MSAKFSSFFDRATDIAWLQTPERLLAFDPGETLGYCLVTRGNGIFEFDTGEMKFSSLESGIQKTNELYHQFNPTHLVYEDYRVYGWKAKDHAWQELFTPKLIGAIETIASLHNETTTRHKQMAQVAKAFCTDQKLKEWNLYDRGLKHGRDAVRHACYYLLFNHKKTLEKTS